MLHNFDKFRPYMGVFDDALSIQLGFVPLRYAKIPEATQTRGFLTFLTHCMHQCFTQKSRQSVLHRERGVAFPPSLALFNRYSVIDDQRETRNHAYSFVQHSARQFLCGAFYFCSQVKILNEILIFSFLIKIIVPAEERPSRTRSLPPNTSCNCNNQ